MSPEEFCWNTGRYTDECQCEICMHRSECSAGGEDEDDDED